MQNFFSSHTFEENWWFILTVSNNVWHLYSRDEQPGSAQCRFLKVRTDGKDVYSMAYITSNPNELPFFGTNVGQLHMGASAAPGNLPITSLHRLIWLAFGPKEAQDETKRELFELPGRDFPTNLTTKVMRFEEEPKLPRKIEYYLPGYMDFVDKSRVHYPKPFDSGWLCAEFSTSATTNFQGLTIPLGFTVKGYRLAPDYRSPTGTVISSLISCRVEDVRGLSRTLQPRGTAKDIPVIDYRFQVAGSGGEGLKYTVKDEQWLTATNPKIKLIIAETKMKVWYYRVFHSQNAPVIVSALLLMLAVLLSLMFWHSK